MKYILITYEVDRGMIHYTETCIVAHACKEVWTKAKKTYRKLPEGTHFLSLRRKHA